MNCQMILVSDSIGVDILRVNTGIKVVPGINKLEECIYENLRNVDSIIPYVSDGDIDEVLKSGILDLPQVKCVVCCCDSPNDAQLAQSRYNKIPKFDFCLKTEVENRIRNNIDTDLLNSSRPLDRSLWSTKFADRRQHVQMKQKDLAASQRRIVGFDTRNKSAIHSLYHCRICSLILRDPVQLECGHRQCKSCVEAVKGEMIKCPECQEETQKKDVWFDRGFKNDMQLLETTCSLCDWKGILKHYEDHLATSHPNPSCQYCEKTCDSANNLNLHKFTECDRITVPCVLKDYGCSSSVLRCEMSEPYMTEQHLTAICRILSKFATDQLEGASVMDVDSLSHTTTSLPENSNSQLQEVCETVDVLAGGIQALNEDTQQLSDESLQLQNPLDALTKDFAGLKLSIQEQNTYIDGIKPNQEILHQDVASLEQKIEDLQFTSHDGSLTWKMSNFAEKMADAESERQTSIYSPPFYSSPTGYKMRARLYLHGDGNARRTHISLFFVLMRGGYDAILGWPFNYKVTFCLYDQTPAQRHVIDSFRPDIKSNSFQRPRTDMNIASGIPKFFPLPMIQQEENPYIRDDTIFIKIMVDFGDMPKTVLFYALSLNPGLPPNEHDAQCRMKMEEDKQQGAARIAKINRDDKAVAQRSLIHSYPRIPPGNRQQTSPSATDSESSTRCQDVSDDE